MGRGEQHKGHCLCGRTRFAFEGLPRFMAHCHCESCRRATASPFTSYLGVPDGAWRWTGQPAGQYESSPGVTRSFCTTCGTPMAYRSVDYPGEMHFFAATLDDPSNFAPTVHVHTDEMLPWVKLADDLPRK